MPRLSLPHVRPDPGLASVPRGSCCPWGQSSPQLCTLRLQALLRDMVFLGGKGASQHRAGWWPRDVDHA